MMNEKEEQLYADLVVRLSTVIESIGGNPDACSLVVALEELDRLEGVLDDADGTLPYMYKQLIVDLSQDIAVRIKFKLSAQLQRIKNKAEVHDEPSGWRYV